MGRASARAALLLLVLAPQLVLASPAALDAYILGVPPSIDPLTGKVGTRGGYAPSVVVADVAGTLTFTNLDIAGHDVVSAAEGTGSEPWCARFVGHHPCPLFASALVGFGESSVVEGIDRLEPGTTYGFSCSVHDYMTGTLVAV